MDDTIRIVTDRLILNPINENDYDFIVTLEQIPENKVYEMEGVLDSNQIIEQCNEFLMGSKQLPDKGAIKFIVNLKNGESIGTVSLVCNWEKTKEWELGYSLLPQYFHKGYAYESTNAVIRFAFDELKIHKLMAFVNANNHPSLKLLERLNMKLEGHMREARLINDQWADEKVYAFLKSDLEYIEEMFQSKDKLSVKKQ